MYKVIFTEITFVDISTGWGATAHGAGNPSLPQRPTEVRVYCYHGVPLTQCWHKSFCNWSTGKRVCCRLGVKHAQCWRQSHCNGPRIGRRTSQDTSQVCTPCQYKSFCWNFWQFLLQCLANVFVSFLVTFMTVARLKTTIREHKMTKMNLFLVKSSFGKTCLEFTKPQSMIFKIDCVSVKMLLYRFNCLISRKIPPCLCKSGNRIE